ncbi:phosphatidylinositol phosphodiesterase, partial [Bacillus thuringiensis]
LNGLHSNENEILISQISSESSPLSGQQNRSSQNFKIDSLPVGTKELKWVIEPSEKDYSSTISFNVMIDVSLGIDSTRWKNISHGSRTEAYTNTKYYIASPTGATNKFTVKIYAITN